MRRTGMFEAPSNVVSVQRIESPIGDTSSVWRALSETAQSLTQLIEPVARQHAVTSAQRDASQGRYGLRLPLTEADALYNNAMTQSYLLAMERDVDSRVTELEAEHAADADGFANAFQSVREGFMSNAPADLAPHLDEFLRQRESSAVSRIGERVRNIAIQSYAQNAEARLAQMEARLSGFEDLQNEEFQRLYGEYEEVGRALTENPLSGITAEEWDFRRNGFHSRMMAQQVAQEAFDMYQEGGANAQAAQSALEFIDREVRNNGDLVLTPAQRDASYNEARREIMRAEAERQRREREFQAQLRFQRAMIAPIAREQMAGAQAMAQSMLVIPDDTMAALSQVVAESGNPTLARQLNELTITNETRRRLQGLPQAEIEREVTNLRNAAQEGDLDAAIELQAAEQYRDAVRRADPVTALQIHQGQQPASLDEGFGPRIRQMEAFSQQTGRRNVEYLSPSEREQLAAALQQSDNPVDILRVVVSDAMAEPGNGRVRVGRMLHEITGRAGPEYAAIGDVLIRGGNASVGAARVMEQALRNRRTEGARVNRGALLPPNLSDGAQQEAIVDVLGDHVIATMTPEEIANVRTAADLYYEGRALNDPSVYANEQSFRRAYRGAIEAALGGVTRDVGGRRYSFGGVATTGRNIEGSRGFNTYRAENQVVIPNWIRRDQFQTVMNSLTAGDFREAGGGVTPLGGTVTDWREGRLVPTGRAVGEYYMVDRQGGRYMVGEGAERRPYVLDLNRLRASLSERRPDAIAE